MGHLVQGFNSFWCNYFFKVSEFLTQRKTYNSDVSVVIFYVFYVCTWIELNASSLPLEICKLKLLISEEYVSD